MKKALLILAMFFGIFYSTAFLPYCYADEEEVSDYQNGYEEGYEYGLHNPPLQTAIDGTPVFRFTNQQSADYQQGYIQGYANAWQQRNLVNASVQTVDAQADQQNGYETGYKDGASGAGYNNIENAQEEWKKGYHQGYLTGRANYQDYLEGYKKGYADASNDQPATPPPCSSRFYIRGCMDGYNAYHDEFKTARQDGYMDGCNGISIKDLSQSTATYQKGYRSGYDYAITHGLTEYSGGPST